MFGASADPSCPVYIGARLGSRRNENRSEMAEKYYGKAGCRSGDSFFGRFFVKIQK